MLEFAALLSVYVSFAMLYAANPERLPSQWQRWPRAGWGFWLRATALGALGVSALLFTRQGALDAGFLVVSSGLMAVTTIFILLISIWPKVMWALAFASPPTIVGLIALAGAHG